MKLQLKRSNVLEQGSAKAPTVEQMEYGELAVNYNSSDPVLFIKDSNDNVIRLTNIQTIGDGAFSVNAGIGLTASGDNATANQTIDTVRVLDVDETWLANFVDTNGNGQININAGSGLEASGSNASANQSSDTTRVLSVKLKQDGGLLVDGNGLSVNFPEITAGDGITNDGSSLSVQADPGWAIDVTASGLRFGNNWSNIPVLPGV